MKSLNVRKLLFFLLVSASLCSYIYMNITELEQGTVLNEKEESSYFEEEVKQDAILPDVRILQKVIETGRRILPSSR